jgi:hypothetical protein
MGGNNSREVCRLCRQQFTIGLTNRGMMKKRYLYALLFGVPGFFVAVIVTLILFGAVAGVLWLFVFGDDPWPSFTGPVLATLGIGTFLLFWLGLTWLGYRMGGRLEPDPRVNRGHILLSAGFTLLFILLIVAQQFRVGNLGPKSESVLCSEYCYQQGYSGSGMPVPDSGERTCSCYDTSGNETIKIPLESIETETAK